MLISSAKNCGASCNHPLHYTILKTLLICYTILFFETPSTIISASWLCQSWHKSAGYRAFKMHQLNKSPAPVLCDCQSKVALFIRRSQHLLQVWSTQRNNSPEEIHTCDHGNLGVYFVILQGIRDWELKYYKSCKTKEAW